MQVLKPFVTANRGWKANCHFIQNVWKRSSVSRAHLSPHAYTAGVEWCGIGHWELCTSFTSHLHSWCGMVWYRTLRVNISVRRTDSGTCSLREAAIVRYLQSKKYCAYLVALTNHCKRQLSTARLYLEGGGEGGGWRFQVHIFISNTNLALRMSLRIYSLYCLFSWCASGDYHLKKTLEVKVLFVLLFDLLVEHSGKGTFPGCGHLMPHCNRHLFFKHWFFVFLWNILPFV